MRRLQQLNLHRGLPAASSDEDVDGGADMGIAAAAVVTIDDREKESDDGKNPILIPPATISATTTTTTMAPLIRPIAGSSVDEIHARCTLLPAYPSLERSITVNLQDHLLLANVPRDLLNKEQRRRYEERHRSPSPFQLIAEKYQNTYPSFFLTKYRELFMDVKRRLLLNDAIVDYNYVRLLKCFDLMARERIDVGLQKHPRSDGDVLPIHEYPVALEFFLQIDRDVFFMKTCSFRGAIACQPSNFDGIFCLKQPYPCYGLAACRKPYCHFCFPPPDVASVRSRHHRPVVRFGATQKHTFVSGYQSMLNCPTTCETKNILYALTCPCGEYDYIGCTSMRLDQRLAYHREHGNRIIHEFLLGSNNIRRMQTRPKSFETLVKDDMLLYKHSARCPAAMQLFLDCNPQYWPFIPMLEHEAQRENQSYQMPRSIPQDPSSLVVTSAGTGSEHEAGCYMTDLPPLPSNRYTFSARQSVEQFLYFKNKADSMLPNSNLDLYNAPIIVVLPDQCSTPLSRLLEALLITHAQTKLNTLGHLDGSLVPRRLNSTHPSSKNTDMVADRGDWCRQLLRRPSLRSHT